ncbi:hypothetical protein, partial [Methylomonas rivi]|uniref:hypothetical protein n=1 Tax=Methylomonas rivi TaxID=2952226 RepID=UPI003531AD07
AETDSAPGFPDVFLSNACNYLRNNSSFCPIYILIATSAPTINTEKKNGGLWNSSMAKSATNKLVNKGWSTKPIKIFLNISPRS